MTNFASKGFKELSKNKMKKVKGGIGYWMRINDEWIYIEL